MVYESIASTFRKPTYTPVYSDPFFCCTLDLDLAMMGNFDEQKTMLENLPFWT